MPERQTRRLRVAIFAPHYAEYTVRLATALARKADVLLVAETANVRNECRDSLVSDARRALKLVTYDAHSRIGRVVATARVPAAIAAFRPDVLHVQEQPDKLTARIVGLLRWRLPILMTVHDPRPHSGRDAAYARRQDVFRQRLRAAASAFHVHGDHCRREMIHAVGTGRAIVDTLHGVILCPEPAERRAPEGGRMLFFGRMEAYKGLETLLDAADILQRDNVACRIVVAGRGPELDRLRPRLLQQPCIEVLEKFLTPAEATEQFQRAEIVVAPYQDATQSGVVAAAVGNGRAIVASAVGGLVDAVSDGVSGLLLEPGRPDVLAEALTGLIDDRGRLLQLLAGSEAEAAGRFAWDRITDDLLAAYGGLLRR
ncbi:MULTISPECIES: glycosyltransferase family 4 protein [Methylobacterium]|uniref:glycosyltransferase family 4 protein n=1 Tax=Methylobacterium TaxID=407 RepID=UPI0012E76327|nr:glycosyltransferase family 4 protein [Methylobacterium sp. Leaf104]MCI9879204.1 glycosyltransferase family 4 protein [Methylobacterium goesingense]